MTKKKSCHNPPKPTRFRANPFSALKGVTVTDSQQSVPFKPETTRKPIVEDDTDLFLQAMDDVKRLDAFVTYPKIIKQPTETDSTDQFASERESEKERIDSEIFSRAIDQLKLDVTFCDHTPENEEIKPLGHNRLRQLKRGIVSIERQLDLHGLTRQEALSALPSFLKSASVHGEKAVLIITGKGNNSPAEPVLQQAVVGWLRDAGKKLVVEFAPAPREMGGSGALVVFLRG